MQRRSARLSNSDHTTKFPDPPRVISRRKPKQVKELPLADSAKPITKRRGSRKGKQAEEPVVAERDASPERGPALADNEVPKQEESLPPTIPIDTPVDAMEGVVTPPQSPRKQECPPAPRKQVHFTTEEPVERLIYTPPSPSPPRFDSPPPPQLTRLALMQRAYDLAGQCCSLSSIAEEEEEEALEALPAIAEKEGQEAPAVLEEEDVDEEEAVPLPPLSKIKPIQAEEESDDDCMIIGIKYASRREVFDQLSLLAGPRADRLVH